MTTSDNATKDSGFRITRIRAKNYRSIRELDMELGSLTVLVGPNASGKSNVLDVFRFIRDAISHGLDFAVSQRHGIRSLRHQHRPGRGRPRDLEVGFNATVQESSLEYSFILTSDSNGGHRVKREYGWYRPHTASSARVVFDIKGGRVIKPQPVPDFELGDLDTEDLSFFRYRRFLLDGTSKESEFPRPSVSGSMYRINRELSRLGFHHVFPNTIREPQRQIAPDRLDEYGENLASVLREMHRSKAKSRLRNLRRVLKQVTPGITDVRSTPAGGYLVLKFKHSNITEGGEMWLDAAQESDGTLRMLALLTAIYQRRRPFISRYRGAGVSSPSLGFLAILADVYAGSVTSDADCHHYSQPGSH